MFKFYDEGDAENEFWKTLDGFYRNYGYKGCVSAAVTKAWFEETKLWAKRSATAQQVVSTVRDSGKTIHVVGMRGGFQCFSSTDGLDTKKPTIFVDIEGRHEIFAHSSHNMHLDPTLYPWLRYTDHWVALDNRITLLHEIGHAKQWLEKPQWFDHDFRDQADTGGVKTIDKTAAEIRRKVAEREARLQAGKMQMTRATDHKRREVRTDPVAQSSLPDKEHADAFDARGNAVPFAPPEWSVHAEMDNMRRHEWPICEEMGLPLRTNYGNIRLDTGVTPSASTKTTQIARIARERLDADKQRAQASLGTNVASTGTARLCPKCGGSFVMTMVAFGRHTQQCKG